MSERREWWLSGERKIVCNSYESAAAMNEGVVHVREVFPTDDIVIRDALNLLEDWKGPIADMRCFLDRDAETIRDLRRYVNSLGYVGTIEVGTIEKVKNEQ